MTYGKAVAVKVMPMLVDKKWAVHHYPNAWLSRYFKSGFSCRVVDRIVQ